MSNSQHSPVAACHKPRKIVVPLNVGLAWRGGGGYRYEEKMDGRFAQRRDAETQSIILGEQMRDGRFFAFDCIMVGGQDIRRAPLRERLECLNRFSYLRPPCGNGGEFLEAVLARGGEGVVAKALDAPYGEMFACKRLWEGLCIVTGFCGGTNSVEISRQPSAVSVEDLLKADSRTLIASAIPCGRLPLHGGKCDRVRIGSILKVQGMNLTETGKIREPRVCSDTPGSWLVKW